MKRALASLVIISFILASISPACKFISGQSLMEFCGADGSVQTMAAPEELLAFLPDQPPSEDQQQTNDLCQFCFSSAHIDYLKSDPLSFLANRLEIEKAVYYKSAKLRLTRTIYQPRAPPAFV